MPDLVAADVTYTPVGKTEIGKQSRQSVLDIGFGNGSLTYPTGGVPLTLTNLGLKRNIEALTIADQVSGDGLLYKWDRANNKIRIFFPTQQTAGTGNRAGVEYTGGSTAVAATVLRVTVRGW